MKRVLMNTVPSYRRARKKQAFALLLVESDYHQSASTFRLIRHDSGLHEKSPAGAGLPQDIGCMLHVLFHPSLPFHLVTQAKSHRECGAMKHRFLHEP